MNQDNFSVRFENRFIIVNYDVIMSGLLTAYEIAVYVTAVRLRQQHGGVERNNRIRLF